MLEAKLQQAAILKKLLDAIKELVSDGNFACNEEHMSLQAMDNSHVALVSVKLMANGFKRYRCDRPMSLGVNMASLGKVLKCAKDDDILTLKATDEADVLNLVYEAKNSDRIAEYDMKLMEIDSDSLDIPDTEYDARVTMPASELLRIVRDLSQLGESVRIEVSKEGVRFISEGEAANGNILLRQSDGAPVTGGKIVPDSGVKEEEDDEEKGDEDEDEEKPKIKKEKDADVDMDDEDNNDEDGEEEKEDDDDEDEEGDSSSKKRKKKANGSSKPSKKAKTSKKAKKGEDEEEEPAGVHIEMNQHVSLTFSLKYLVNFSKSATLSNTVKLLLSNDVPLLVAYDFKVGHIHYYLAPKIGDE